MKLKVGSLIYCHTTGHMNGSGEMFCKEGDYYKITGFPNTFRRHKVYTMLDAKGNKNHEFAMSELLSGRCRWFSPGPVLLVEAIDKRFNFDDYDY